MLLRLSLILLLAGCDGDYERQQREAQFYQRFYRAAMPRVGEPRVCEIVWDKIICYPKGKPRQPVVAGNLGDMP